MGAAFATMIRKMRSGIFTSGYCYRPKKRDAPTVTALAGTVDTRLNDRAYTIVAAGHEIVTLAHMDMPRACTVLVVLQGNELFGFLMSERGIYQFLGH